MVIRSKREKHSLNDFFSGLQEVHHRLSAAIEMYEEEANSVPSRRYSMTDLADLLGVTRKKLYELYAEPDKYNLTPLLIQEGNNRKYATIEHLLELYQVLDKRPGRGKDELGVAIAFNTPKGGSYKTSSTFTAAADYSELGYKVCVIDLDPQGTQSMFWQMQPDIQISAQDTLYGWMIRHEDYPLNIESMKYDLTRLVEDPDVDSFGCIRPTRLPNVDVIPACLSLDMASLEMTMALARAQDNNEKVAIIRSLYRLREIVDLLKKNYDIVLVDGTPSFGVFGFNIFFACDTLIVPVATEMADIAATNAYLRMMEQHVDDLKNIFDESQIYLPRIRYMVTKYSETQEKVEERELLGVIRTACGGAAFDNIAKRSTGATKSFSKLRAPCEVNASDHGYSSSQIAKARNMYREIYREILETEIHPHWEKYHKEES